MSDVIGSPEDRFCRFATQMNIGTLTALKQCIVLEDEGNINISNFANVDFCLLIYVTMINDSYQDVCKAQ